MTARSLLALFAFVFCGVFAQAPVQELENVLGVPWAAPLAQAKEGFKTRAKGQLDRANTNDKQLRFTGEKFAGFKLESTKAVFANGQMCEVEFSIVAPSKKHEKELKELQAMLTQKYGTPHNEELVSGGSEVVWLLKGQFPTLIWLIQNPSGSALRLVYRCDDIKHKARAANAAAQPVKPPAAKQREIDDL